MPFVVAALHLQHVADRVDAPDVLRVARDRLPAQRLGLGIVAGLLEAEGEHRLDEARSPAASRLPSGQRARRAGSRAAVPPPKKSAWCANIRAVRSRGCSARMASNAAGAPAQSPARPGLRGGEMQPLARRGVPCQRRSAASRLVAALAAKPGCRANRKTWARSRWPSTRAGSAASAASSLADRIAGYSPARRAAPPRSARARPRRRRVMASPRGSRISIGDSLLVAIEPLQTVQPRPTHEAVTAAVTARAVGGLTSSDAWRSCLRAVERAAQLAASDVRGASHGSMLTGALAQRKS